MASSSDDPFVATTTAPGDPLAPSSPPGSVSPANSGNTDTSSTAGQGASGVVSANQPSVTWTLIEAREIDPPAGVEPLHWRLWTNLPAATGDECLVVLRYYRFRWRVEDFHLTLKSGCQVEKLELETAERLIKALTLYSAVAIRIVSLRDLVRVTPHVPCTTILTQDEWQALWLRFSKSKLTSTTPPPTLEQAMRWIGRLGGHMGRKRDGMPGVRTLWRGFRDLSLLAAGFHAGRTYR